MPTRRPGGDAMVMRRGRTLQRGVLALLTTLVVLATAVLTASEAGATSSRLTLLSANLCGNACGTRMAVVSDLEQAMRARAPYAVSLQEVCRSQFSRLLLDLPAYRGRFATTLPKRCWDGSDYGIAVLLRTRTFSTAGEWWLPNPGGNEPRKLLCLQSSVAGASQPFITCTVHVDYHAANLASQVRAVADRTRALYRGHKVMVGGDVNTTPGAAALNTMYDSSYWHGTGVFEEADATNHRRSGGGPDSTYNEYTSCGSMPCGPANRKIDYVFLSRYDFVNRSADATNLAHSDHALLWAWAALT